MPLRRASRWKQFAREYGLGDAGTRRFEYFLGAISALKSIGSRPNEEVVPARTGSIALSYSFSFDAGLGPGAHLVNTGFQR